MLSGSSQLRDRLWDNAKYFREEMTKAGFDIVEGNTAIVPGELYDEPLAMKMADMFTG
jgi:glycine C-acetyltransferase